MTTSSLHSPGFWDHMPPAHKLNIVMNDGYSSDYTEEPLEEQTLPARPTRRSHTNAWIFGLAVTATGAAVAVAVANGHDPRSLGYKVEAALADMKGKSTNEADKPADTTPAGTTTASSDTPATNAAQVTPDASTPAPATSPAPAVAQVAQADVPVVAPAVKPAPEVSQKPLPMIAPAVGRSTVKPAPEAAAPRHLASLTTPSATQELRATDMAPVEVAPVNPVTPVTPISPVNPLTPVTPVTPPASAPLIFVPPPVSPPASVPPTQPQAAGMDSRTGE